jgi:hypothetical protein
VRSTSDAPAANADPRTPNASSRARARAPHSGHARRAPDNQPRDKDARQHDLQTPRSR